MRICITLDDVMRAKTSQFGKIYQKYINPDIELENLDLGTDDLSKVFHFDSVQAYNDFLYKDYPFEVFAEAPVVKKMLDKNFNLWLLELEDLDKKVEISFSNPREFNASIGFTYFFLSQIASRVREVFFPKDYYEIWDKCDVLVTADPKLLNEKPEGKKSVKIEMPYNKDCNADKTYKGLWELIGDKTFIDTICDENNETTE